jgi:hypothetical protein
LPLLLLLLPLLLCLQSCCLLHVVLQHDVFLQQRPALALPAGFEHWQLSRRQVTTTTTSRALAQPCPPTSSLLLPSYNKAATSEAAIRCQAGAGVVAAGPQLAQCRAGGR